MTEPRPSEPVLRSGRDAAFLAVRNVLAGRGFVADRLRTMRVSGELAEREAGLATELALGAVRHAVTIEHLLSAVARYDRRRTPTELRAVLLTAVYQIVWMDRVPVFAAADEAVGQARRYVGRRSPGMVNAILRNLTRTLAERRTGWQRLDPAQVRVAWDQACAFSRPVLPDPAASDAHLAAATGERAERYAALVARHGAADAERCAWAAQAVPVTVLQRNRLRIGAEDFGAQVHAAFGDDVELVDDAAFLSTTARLRDLSAFADGLAFVQDPSAHAAARLVEAQAGERVLDLCAAPGGKSIVLAQQMQDRGEVLACDVSEARLARVRENVDRLGLKCVRIGPPPSAAADPFDGALVDVPCSNTAVIARRPEARLGFTEKKLRSLVTVQRDLIAVAARYVRPGGRLVYSTCSLEPEENEQVVAWFLAQQPNWRVDTQQTTLPAWGPRPADWHDGGFAARLVHAGGGSGQPT